MCLHGGVHSCTHGGIISCVQENISPRLLLNLWCATISMVCFIQDALQERLHSAQSKLMMGEVNLPKCGISLKPYQPYCLLQP